MHNNTKRKTYATEVSKKRPGNNGRTGSIKKLSDAINVEVVQCLPPSGITVEYLISECTYALG